MSDWQKLLEPDIIAYIKSHENSELSKLALSGSPDPDWPFHLILEQIKLRRKAKTKLPGFHDIAGYIFISQDLLEQASSEACASYKASLITGETFCDLTAGHGIDSYFIARHFKKAHLVEREPTIAKMLQHNFDALARQRKLDCDITVHCSSAEDFLYGLEKVDCIYLDPQRRSDGKRGIYDLNKTSPDVISLLPLLRKRAKRVLLKTSAFLDVSKTIQDLKFVSEVHVLQYQDDCKEVLYVLDFEMKIRAEEIRIIAVDIKEDGKPIKEFQFSSEDEAKAKYSLAMPQNYIYEAGPAFMKAGGFKLLAERFKLKKLHSQTHLYTSNSICQEFPGKFYKVEDLKPVQSKGLTIRKADLAIRNFPGGVEYLHKKLKIKDGGLHRIYACTLMDETKRLVICTKD